MPGAERRMHNLDPCHAFRFSREHGIWMQWKQWCTDTEWSKPVQMLSELEARKLAKWLPVRSKMAFPDGGGTILDCISKLEAWCAAQPPESQYLGLHNEFAWLRAAVQHQVPGAYAPGTEVEDLLRDLRGLPHTPPGADASGQQFRQVPQDIIAQMYPGADLPNIPLNALVRIGGVTHTYTGSAMRSTII